MIKIQFRDILLFEKEVFFGIVTVDYEKIYKRYVFTGIEAGRWFIDNLYDFAIIESAKKEELTTVLESMTGLQEKGERYEFKDSAWHLIDKAK